MAYIYKGNNITNKAFIHDNGTTYLPTWILELSTVELRDSLGITEVSEVPQKTVEISPKQVLLDRIGFLELSITSRRLREAVLGVDNGWLQSVNSEITNLRTQLKTA